MTKRPFMDGGGGGLPLTSGGPFRSRERGGEGGWKTRWISGKGPGGGGVRTDCCQDPPRPPSSEAANESVSPPPPERRAQKEMRRGASRMEKEGTCKSGIRERDSPPTPFLALQLACLKKGNRLVPPILGKFILFDLSFPHQFLLL